MQKVSLAEARERGLKRYFTGKPCKHGHVAERRTANQRCVVCERERAKVAMARKRQSSIWRERLNAQRRAWGARHPATARTQKRAYYVAHRDRLQLAGRQNYSQNPARYKAAAKARLALLQQRIPGWADLEAIKFFYECCPAGCHVDHIVPLRGKYVSGLHVETNLQWVPAEYNLRKHNNPEYNPWAS